LNARIRVVEILKGGGEPWKHQVPLSDQAIQLLRSLLVDDKPTSPYVFPGRKHLGYLGQSAMLSLLGRIGWNDLTATHGIRAAFKTWATERTNYPREVVELCLAHVQGDPLERAYQWGDIIEKRKSKPSISTAPLFYSGITKPAAELSFHPLSVLIHSVMHIRLVAGKPIGRKLRAYHSCNPTNPHHLLPPRSNQRLSSASNRPPLLSKGDVGRLSHRQPALPDTVGQDHLQRSCCIDPRNSSDDRNRPPTIGITGCKSAQRLAKSPAKWADIVRGHGLVYHYERQRDHGLK
jgi:hypothetical protein